MRSHDAERSVAAQASLPGNPAAQTLPVVRRHEDPLVVRPRLAGILGQDQQHTENYSRSEVSQLRNVSAAVLQSALIFRDLAQRQEPARFLGQNHRRRVVPGCGG